MEVAFLTLLKFDFIHLMVDICRRGWLRTSMATLLKYAYLSEQPHMYGHPSLRLFSSCLVSQDGILLVLTLFLVPGLGVPMIMILVEVGWYARFANRLTVRPRDLIWRLGGLEQDVFGVGLCCRSWRCVAW